MLLPQKAVGRGVRYSAIGLCLGYYSFLPALEALPVQAACTLGTSI